MRNRVVMLPYTNGDEILVFRSNCSIETTFDKITFRQSGSGGFTLPVRFLSPVIANPLGGVTVCISLSRHLTDQDKLILTRCGSINYQN